MHVLTHYIHRDALKMTSFFKGGRSWGVWFYFLFLNVCPWSLSVCLYFILFPVLLHEKACTITKPISGQFKLVFFRIIMEVEILGFLKGKVKDFFCFCFCCYLYLTIVIYQYVFTPEKIKDAPSSC